jgi:hypothetical protein
MTRPTKAGRRSPHLLPPPPWPAGGCLVKTTSLDARISFKTLFGGVRPRQSPASSNQRSAAVTTRNPSQIWKLRSGWALQTMGISPLPLDLQKTTLGRLLPHPLRPAKPPEKRGSGLGPSRAARRRAGRRESGKGGNESLQMLVFCFLIQTIRTVYVPCNLCTFVLLLLWLTNIEIKIIVHIAE